MSRLEGELTVEIKRRTEMNKSTQIVSKPMNYTVKHFIVILFLLQWFEDQLSNINQQFHETLDKRKQDTEIKLEALNQRITDLDKYFEEQKASILKYIDDRGEELTRLLNQFKVRYCNYEA